MNKNIFYEHYEKFIDKIKKKKLQNINKNVNINDININDLDKNFNMDDEMKNEKDDRSYL